LDFIFWIFFSARTLPTTWPHQHMHSQQAHSHLLLPHAPAAHGHGRTVALADIQDSV